MKTHNVIIIGSGPAGYTAAIYAARAELAPLVFEGALDSGGALMNTTEVENYPGFKDGIMGPELMDQMRAQAQRFGAELIRDDVTEVSLDSEIKVVKDSAGQEYHAKAVIIATGAAHRKLGIDREDELSGRGVSYCATCDGFFFRDKPIVVVGGGDSAVEEATFLARFGSSVTLVHRRDQLRASKIMQERLLANPKIEVAWNSQVVEFHGENELSEITLQDTVTGETREIPANGLFVAIGHIPRSGLFQNQIALDDNGYIKVAGRSTATSLPGVFAAGDVVDHTYRQAITAAAMGCQAALDAERFLLES